MFECEVCGLSWYRAELLCNCDTQCKASLVYDFSIKKRIDKMQDLIDMSIKKNPFTDEFISL